METILDRNRIGFNEASHIYTLDGNRIYSTTSIIHAFGDSYATVPERVLQRKAIIGSRVHAATEILDMGLEPDDEDENTKPYLDAYRRFQDDHKPKVLESEQIMVAFSDAMFGEQPYGMTLDRISEITVDGETSIWLLDLKTSANRHMDSWQIQLGGYGNGIMQWAKYRGKEFKAGIVHLKKNGHFTLIPIDWKSHLVQFNACVSTFYYFTMWDKQEPKRKAS